MKGGGLSVVIAAGKPKPKGGEESGSDSLAASKRILTAIKDEDAQALDDALQEHYACCMGDEPDEDDADKSED